MLLISIFPGIDGLGLGFEQEGFCVVRGPDLIWGGDVRNFHAEPGKFDGVIGGTPCPDFSKKRRTPPTGNGVAMLRQFARIVWEAQPDWWLLENVPGVPDVEIAGYTVQRFNLNARECGLRQRRNRRFQFGSRNGLVLIPERQKPHGAAEPTALATEGKSKERTPWPDFCERQSFPRTFNIPGVSIAAKYAAVGNAVPPKMARVIARAVIAALTRTEPVRLCICDCGRVVTGDQKMAGPACRKRMERRRKRATPRPEPVEGAKCDVTGVTVPGVVTWSPVTSPVELFQASDTVAVTLPGKVTPVTSHFPNQW